MKTIFLYITLTMILVSPARADVHGDNFAQLIGQQPTVEINLGPTMLNLLSSASKDEEGISAILSSLTAINVTVFELDQAKNTGSNQGKILSIKSEINKLAEDKASSGYEKIATIKEDDSLVYIFAKMTEKKFSSLSIFALDDEDELVLINISGNILMSQIGELMEHFDVNLDLNDL